MISAELLVILQQIQLHNLQTIAYIQRNGKALAEPAMPLNALQDRDVLMGVASIDEIMPLPAPTYDTLGERVKRKAEQDKQQMTIDDAISPADKTQGTQASTPATEKLSKIEVLSANAKWAVERRRREFEIYRNKTDAINLCYGFENCNKFIDRLIKDLSKQKSTDEQ